MADVDELGGGGATEFGAFRFRDETGKISSAEAGAGGVTSGGQPVPAQPVPIHQPGAPQGQMTPLSPALATVNALMVTMHVSAPGQPGVPMGDVTLNESTSHMPPASNSVIEIVALNDPSAPYGVGIHVVWP